MSLYYNVNLTLHYDNGARHVKEVANKTDSWEQQTKKNTLNLAYWTAAWTASMALVTFGPVSVWESSLFTILALILNVGLGLGMILANKRHLKGLDEMHQKIQLEGMGITLGVGLVCGLAYSSMDTINLIAIDAEISHLVILMGLTYLATIIIGTRRYS